MPKSTVRITGYTFGRVLEERIGKLANDICKRLAEDCADTARENFAAADYAGPKSDIDHIKVEARQTKKGNWSVTASGKAVQYIEFGTGVEGTEIEYEGNYPPSYHPAEYRDESFKGEPPNVPFFPREGENPQHFWVFWAKKGPPVSHAEPFYRLHRDREEKFKTKIVKMGLDYQSMLVPTGKMGLSLEPTYHEDPVKDLYKTRGNPANSCLYYALVDTGERALELAEEAVK